MISKKSLIIIAMFVALSHASIIHADTIGSDTAVSVESAYTFPTGVDNRIANFGFLKNGFTLQDSLTTCTFDSIFPVSGNVQLNGGTLTLNQDLLFNNITSLQGLGTIFANGHLIDICSSITQFPLNTQLFQDAYLQLNRFITINNGITFKGNNIFNGAGDNLIIGDGGSINVASNSTLLLKNMVIKGIGAGNITLADDTSTLALHNVTLHLTNDVTFSVGAMTIIGNVAIEGSHTLFYTSSQTSTIMQDSQLLIKDGATLSIGRYDATSDVQPLSFVDETSVLKFDQSNFIVTSSGMQITKGTIEIDKFVEVDMQGTTTTFCLVVGDGDSEHDCTMQMDSGASLRFGSGYFTYNCGLPNRVISSSSNAQFIRSASSNIYVARSIVFPASTIVLESNLTSAIEVAPDTLLGYDNVQISIPESLFSVKCDRYNQYTFYLNGNDDYLFLTKGVMPLYVFVSGHSNTIEGNGNIAGMVILQDNNAQLTWILNGFLLNTLYMNGGSLVLYSDFNCANGVKPSGAGTVHMANNSFNFGQADLNISDAMYWDGIKGVVNVNSNIALSNTWTFSGECILDCHNHILDISSGNIVVEKGSHLTIRNVKIQNIAGNCITCLDDAASIVLDNIIWLQNGDYAFTQGLLLFRNDVIMRGSSIFAYQSNQVSTIDQHASLMFDDGFTFSYDPINSISSQLLSCINNESQICLNNATLYATGPGLQLTKGKVSIDGTCSLASEVTAQFGDPGITLGDCNAADDLVCVISGGSQLTIAQGSLQYKNVNASSFTMLNSAASLWIGDNASLYLYQNLNGIGMTTFGNNATLAENPSAQLLMGTTQTGILNNVTTPSC